MFEPTVEDGVLQIANPGTRWLSTGWNGGFEQAPVAYNVTVPEGWDRTDLDAYASQRRTRAGFDRPGPTLLTGVEMHHVRGARLDPVVAYATVGVSNPAMLPMAPTGAETPAEKRPDPWEPGTVNIVVGTTRAVTDAALATLLGVVVEAKTATLLAMADMPGTTTDAVVVGCESAGPKEPFTGSGTEIGSAARACVREAVQASFRSRYREEPAPQSADDAEYGVVTDQRAVVFEP